MDSKDARGTSMSLRVSAARRWRWTLLGIRAAARSKSPEAAARGEVFLHRHRERRAFPETHPLREVAAIVGERHGETQQVELRAGLARDGVEDRLLAIDLRFDGGLRIGGGNRIAELEQTP